MSMKRFISKKAPHVGLKHVDALQIVDYFVDSFYFQ